jgi:hypothetical protein
MMIGGGLTKVYKMKRMEVLLTLHLVTMVEVERKKKEKQRRTWWLRCA